ncbi:isochorismatase family cysteine hydrolase [Microbacterium sp. X-17]|uniref:cysteine hydrolase family protein n=1 Tax=Microbacterium sp. X-17 TaxID=3144404 RepID=UPI0031F4D7A9
MTGYPVDALLVVNVQNSFCHPDGAMYEPARPPLHDVEHVLQNIAAALAAARAAYTPVCFVRQCFQPGYADFGHRMPRLRDQLAMRGGLLAGSWDADFVDEVSPNPADLVIDACRADAFYNTPMESLLRSMAVRRLAVVGVTTNGAVETTARSAALRDFDVTVLADCTTSRTAQDRDTSLELLAAYEIADVALASPDLF